MSISKPTYLHQSLLCEVSEFFKKCLEQCFAESASQKVSLPEDSPESFAWFVKWAYSGDLAPLRISDGCDAIPFMANLYVLADKLLCENLKNRSMDMIQEACSVSRLYASDVTEAVERGLTGSKLVQYLVKQLAYEVREGASGDCEFYDDSCMDCSEWWTFFKLDAQLTQKFMCMVISPRTENMLAEDPAFLEGCAWHEHSPPEKPCERWPKWVEESGELR